MKAPKAPKPTAQQLAVERRQAQALDEEIAEQEQRFRAMTRGQLGTRSLLGGIPRTRAEAAGGGSRAAGTSMLGMGAGKAAYGARAGAGSTGKGARATGTRSIRKLAGR